jgi:hypothetical protein
MTHSIRISIALKSPYPALKKGDNIMDVFTIVVAGITTITISVFWKLKKPELILTYKDFKARLGEAEDKNDE